MAEEKTLEQNLGMYVYAKVAKALASAKDERGVKFSLDKLVDKLDAREDMKGFVKKIYGEPKGDKTVADYFSKEYDKLLGSSKVENLRDLYSPYFESYFDVGTEGEEGAREKAYAIFEKFKDDNYGSIEKKVEKAKAIMDAGEDAFGKEEVEDAEKTLKKYGKLMSLINIFEEDRITKLAEPVRKDSRKKLANDIILS